jgi:hypothetical protein
MLWDGTCRLVPADKNICRLKSSFRLVENGTFPEVFWRAIRYAYFHACQQGGIKSAVHDGAVEGGRISPFLPTGLTDSFHFTLLQTTV